MYYKYIDDDKRKKKRKKKVKTFFKKNHCAPKFSGRDDSCLDDKLLIKIGNILNQYHSADININNDRRTIHDQISQKIKEMSDCGSEKCWLTIQEIIKHLSPDELSLFKSSFKPKKPSKWDKKPRTWLTTNDIESVLKQHMEKYNNFYSYGALPIDFDLKKNQQCVSGELCNIDLQEHFDNGKHNIGIVFNMDKHDESGSHWTSMFVELLPHSRKEPSIYYFDSVGDKPPKQVFSLVDRLQEQFNSLKNMSMDFLYNDIQHQYKDTECGIYCLHFLSNMLDGTDFNKYIKNIKKDDYMHKYRNYFFIDE